MVKYFNTTGLCIGRKHYMVNIINKINKIEKLIEEERYFTINRPRQFGKTTTINMLENNLDEKYLIISLSFEGLGESIFNNESDFSRVFLELMVECINFQSEEEAERLKILGENIKSINDLSKTITSFVKSSNKDVILIIDEVDKSSNNQLFLSFLGMLRNKYLNREKGKDFTFKSVILAGVHDVKTLKLRLNNGEEVKYNSPWNIASNFNVDMSFNEVEIESMLIEYCKDNKIEMDTKYLANKIYYYTSGYPYLVSKICQIIDEDILEKDRKPWQKEYIEYGVKKLLKDENTLFDDLFKNIKNNEDLSEYIFDIVFNGAVKSFNPHNPIINLGTLYGILKDSSGIVKISNRIFEQIIYNYFASTLENKPNNIQDYNYKNNFITPEGGLEIHNKEEGYLLVFDFNSNKEYKNETTTIGGKEIYCTYV